MASLTNLKFVDDRSKLIVSGYIHNIEKKSNSNIIIPDEIINICLIYYFIFESFHQTLHSKNIILKANDIGMENMIATSNHDLRWIMVYGDFIVNAAEYAHCIFEWTLNLRFKAEEIAFGIGIIESCNEVDTNLEEYGFGRGRPFTNYGWHMVYLFGPPTIRRVAKEDRYVNIEKNKRSKITNKNFLKQDEDKGNKVMVQFDIKKKTLKCWINDEDIGIGHEEVDITKAYRFGVAVYYKSARVEIIEFKIKS